MSPGCPHACSPITVQDEVKGEGPGMGKSRVEAKKGSSTTCHVLVQKQKSEHYEYKLEFLVHYEGYADQNI